MHENCNKFIKYENDNNLFDFMFDGINTWIYYRETLYSDIMKEKNYIKDTFTNPSNIKKKLFYRFFKAKMYRYGKFINHFNDDCDVLFFSHPRRIYDKGFYHCVITDEIIQNMKRPYKIIEEPYWIDGISHLVSHYTPTKEKIVYLDKLELSFEVSYDLYGKRRKIQKSDEEKLYRIISKLNKEFNTNISFSKYYELNKKFSYYEKHYLSKYVDLLKNINPKLIVEFYNPNRTRQIINKAAHKLEIKIVNLQHGMFGLTEPLMMNYHSLRHLDNFPDEIWTFGQYWNGKSRFPIDKNRITSVGYPYHERKKKEEFKKEKRNKKIILFVSQGKIGERLSKIAFALSKKDLGQKYDIVFKTHPFEQNRWKKDYPWLLNSKVIVDDNNKADLYHYFGMAICQVGVYSTGVYEGISCGIETFIYKDYGVWEVEDLAEKYPNVHLIDKAQDIEAYFLNNKIKRYNISYEDLFESNSISKILKNLNERLDSLKK